MDAVYLSTFMFSTLGLFHKLPCPDKQNCTRPQCIFSHDPSAAPSPSLIIPVQEPKQSPSSAKPTNNNLTIPTKRSVPQSSALAAGLRNGSPIGEPPRKLQKLGPTQKQASAPSTSYTSVSAISPHHFGCLVPPRPRVQSGVPILRINAAQSRVAVPVRQVEYKPMCICWPIPSDHLDIQAMVKNLYEHFVVLYEAILLTNPSLASEHALRQEEEVYHKSNKITYRNV
jgi:RNA exonuclease 1